MAFGGVEIGSDIAQEAATATPMRIVWVPPIEVNLSPIPEHTTVRIGMSRAAVAVFEIKLLRMKQTNPETTIITNGLNSANGMLFTAFSAKPVPFMARPRAKPPATIQMTAQSISFRSLAVTTPVKAKTAIGSIATVLALTPSCLPHTQRRMVRKNVAPTTIVRQL